MRLSNRLRPGLSGPDFLSEHTEGKILFMPADDDYFMIFKTKDITEDKITNTLRIKVDLRESGKIQ